MTVKSIEHYPGVCDIIRYDDPVRRRLIADAPPEVDAIERKREADDPISAARGIAWAMALMLLVWIGVIGGYALWVKWSGGLTRP